MRHLFIKKIRFFSAKRQTHLHLVVEIENFVSVFRQNGTFISSGY
nr:MAG TPA_asm: hypothetical protein [Caudoviricetes sp.]